MVEEIYKKKTCYLCTDQNVGHEHRENREFNLNPNLATLSIVGGIRKGIFWMGCN